MHLVGTCTGVTCLLKQAVAQISSLSSEEHVLNRNLLNQVARGASTTPLTIKVILLGGRSRGGLEGREKVRRFLSLCIYCFFHLSMSGYQ